jgi:SAM-dependent methyltransferase
MADRVVLAGYEAEAEALIPRYASVDTAQKLAPVMRLLPTAPSRVADIGAGVGGDAAWFAQQGHAVLAVEPTAAFREAAQARNAGARIEWLDDTLPALSVARPGREGSFDLVLSSAVWAHVLPHDRAQAMASLASLLRPGGRLVLSLRHGPSPATRPAHDAPAEEAIGLAHGEGLELLLREEADSVQAGNRAAGVRWTWLVLQR